jgi:hypothetical protein
LQKYIAVCESDARTKDVKKFQTLADKVEKKKKEKKRKRKRKKGVINIVEGFGWN